MTEGTAAKLVLQLFGADGGVQQRWELDKNAIKIGRLSSADVRLQDTTVSRLHGLIETRSDGTVVVIDLGSKAGIAVNGKRLSDRQVLHHNDRLRLGKTELAVGIERAPDPPDRVIVDLRAAEADRAPQKEARAAEARREEREPAGDATSTGAEARREEREPAGDAIAALLAESRAGAEAVEQGGFRLDWTRALDKIKRFQLTDPHRYVLELVRAAVAGGASRISVETDADDLVLQLDGAPFAERELRQLFDYLFAQEEGLARNRQLALGVNAALGLQPKFIRVESGDGQQGAGLRLSSYSDLAVEPLGGGEVVRGTRIHVRERKGWGVLKDALRGENEEDRLLVAHCRHCPIYITLNGRDLRQGLPGGGAASDELPDRGLTGKFVLNAAPGDPSWVKIYLSGVEVTSLGWDQVGLGAVSVCGYVDNPALTRNASLTDVRRDNEYRRTVRAVRRSIRRLYRAWLRQRLEGERLALSSGDLEEQTRLQRAARLLLRASRKRALPPELEALLDVDDLVRLPFDDQRRGSLRPFWEHYRRQGRILVAERGYEVGVDDLPDDLRWVALPDFGQALSEIFPRTASADARLAAVERAVANRRAREAQRREPVLPAHGVLVKVSLRADDPPMSGEFALMVDDDAVPEGVAVALLREGVPLRNTVIRDALLRGNAVVDCAAFRPTPNWDGVVQDATYKKVGKLLGGAVDDLLHALQQAFPDGLPPPPELVELPRWTPGGVPDAAAPVAWTRSKTAAVARRHADALLRKAPKLPQKLVPWLYTWPLFHRLDGEPISIDQMVAAAGKTVGYVLREPWGEAGERNAGVLNLTSEQKKILRRYLGSRLVSRRKQVQTARARLAQQHERQQLREENLARARRQAQEPVLSGPWNHLVVVDLPAELGRGQAGIPRFAAAQGQWVVQLRLLVDGLPLCELPVEGPAPFPVQAVVQSPAVRPDETFSRPEPSPALDGLVAGIRQQFAPLAAALVREGKAANAEGRELVMRFVEHFARDPGTQKARREALDNLPGEIVEGALLSTALGELVSLRELAREGEAHGDLLWVSQAAVREQLTRRHVIICGEKRAKLLARLLGLKLVDYERQLREEVATLQRMSQPRRAAVLREPTALRVPVKGPEIDGEIGIASGLAALLEKRSLAMVQLLRDGVPLQLRKMNLRDLPLVGVVNSPRFEATSRFDAVVEGHHSWRDANKALRLATDRLLLEACQQLQRADEEGKDDRIAGSALARRVIRGTLRVAAGRHFRGRPSLELEGAPAIDWALARAPIWATAAATFVSLERLAQEVQRRRRLLWVLTEGEGATRRHLAPGRLIVAVDGPATWEAVVGIFGPMLEDGREILEQDETAYRRRQGAQPIELLLDLAEVREPISLGRQLDEMTLRGQVAVLRDYRPGMGGVLVRLGVQGRELCERRLDHPICGRAVLDCDGVAVNEAWTDLADEAHWGRIGEVVGEALWASVARVALRAGQLNWWREDDGVQRELLIDALGALLADGQLAEAHAGLLERLHDVLLFRTVDGRVLSAAQLLAHRVQHGPVLAVSAELARGEPADRRLIVQGSELGLQVLQQLLGEGLARGDDAWREEVSGQRRRREAPRVPPRLEADVVSMTFFREGSTSGVAGLLVVDAHRRRDEDDWPSRIRIHVDRRHVVTRKVDWHPTVEVWLNDDQLTPNPGFDDVIEDESLRRAMTVAQRQLPELVARAAERCHARWADYPGEPLRERLCHYVIDRLDALAEAARSRPQGPQHRLLAAPLWLALDGTLVDSQAVASVGAAGLLATVPTGTRRPWNVEALVLCTGLLLRDALVARFGQVRDFREEIERLDRFEAFLTRPRVVAIDLKAAGYPHTLTKRRLTGDAVEGEIGLLPHGPTRLSITVFHENRQLVVIQRDAHVPAVAAVQSIRLGIDHGYTGLAEGEKNEALLREVDDQLYDVCRQLVEGFGHLQAATQNAARILLLRLARELRPVDREKALRQAIVRAPLLPDVMGRLHAIDACRAEQQSRGAVAVVTPGVAPPTDAGRLVLALDHPVRRLLIDFVTLEDFDDAYRRLHAAQQRREAAPRRADIDWSQVLVRDLVKAGALTGELGLRVPFGHGRVRLMSGGRLVQTVVTAQLPGLIGWIDGPLKTDEAFTRVDLDADQRDTLQRLYQERLEAAVALARERSLDGARAEGREYLALCDYVAQHLKVQLQELEPHRAQRLDRVVGVDRALSEGVRSALKVKLLRVNRDGWETLPEALAGAEGRLVLAKEPVRGWEEDHEGARLLIVPSTVLRELITGLVGDAGWVSHQEWVKRAPRRARRRARRDLRGARAGDYQLLTATKAILRDLVAEQGELKLSFDSVNALSIAEQPRAADTLVLRKAAGSLLLNTAAPAWRAARDALVKPVPHTPHPALHLVAGLIGELRRPDLALATDAAVIAAMTELAGRVQGSEAPADADVRQEG